jgi:hypothetical protein
MTTLSRQSDRFGAFAKCTLEPMNTVAGPYVAYLDLGTGGGASSTRGKSLLSMGMPRVRFGGREGMESLVGFHMSSKWSSRKWLHLYVH